MWAKIGLNSFGGPAGQIAVMHDELVERRRWISERRFLHALNYCMLLPGPEAQQLATYTGWLLHGVGGGVAAGVLFVLPGFVAMLGMAMLYAIAGGVTWVSGLLFGIQAAVIAVVIDAVIRIGRRTLHSAALRVIAGASFIAVFFLHVAFPFVVLGAAAAGWLLGRGNPSWLMSGGGHNAKSGAKSGAKSSANSATAAPALLSDDVELDPRAARSALRAAAVAALLWLVPVLGLVLFLGTENILTQEAVLFSKSAVVTFGGAYAALGYVAQQAVDRYSWISAGDMVTGLGLAETTPGPLVMVLEFVGFLAAYRHPGDLPPLLAGTLGAVVTVWVTFLPCFLFIFAGAPYVERLRSNIAWSHALTAIGAAVAGVVLNLAVWFAVHTLFATVNDQTWGILNAPVPQLTSLRWVAVTIAALAGIAVFQLRWPTLRVVAAAAGLGAAAALTGLVSP